MLILNTPEGESDAGEDVLLRDTVFLGDVVHAISRGQMAQDARYMDPRALDHRLAEADLRVDRDSG